MSRRALRHILGAFMVMCAVVASSATPAAASSDPVPAGSDDVYVLSSDERAVLEQRFVDLGIDSEARPRLLAQLERGQLPDSATGSNEVRSWTEDRDGGTATIVEYADGSRAISGSRPLGTDDSGVIVPYAHNCESQDGAGIWIYGPCQIYLEDLISYAGFTTSWRFSLVDEVPNEILRADSDDCRVFLGSVSECELTVNREVPIPGDPAIARLNYTAALLDDLGSVSGSMWLEVLVDGWGINWTNPPL
ncbi:hypothetical protein GCM10010413_37640 [Promicromonospora sukumoe]|uniref:Uncharacterized protein n=1 Tax=Promicromonospora sukumoe TaxID=88382 RepID=A0A7W3PDM4_9MICO|nr:hypothetical protein [Promicromonospora sukumoe]MBA8807702.1 hypothetical protein [Promicromonospora sukumoe]